MNSLKNLLSDNRGEGYIDVAVLVLCVMLVLALAFSVLPVFTAKQQLDLYAAELAREAEIVGRVGSETTARANELSAQMELSPTNITWSKTGRLQLNEEVTVTVTLNMDIGLFGGFGSFPVELTAKAIGKSEVYWK